MQSELGEARCFGLNHATDAMGGDDESIEVPFTLALIAGGCAGTTVDVALYPLDALKTRLQSPLGFWGAGGFSGIYRGVLATALGASPGSAMFFSACAFHTTRIKPEHTKLAALLHRISNE